MHPLTFLYYLSMERVKIRLSSPLDLTLFTQSVYTVQGSEIPLELARSLTGWLRSWYLTYIPNGSLLSPKMPCEVHIE